MDLAPYVEALRVDVTAAAAVAGPDVARGADLIVDALDPALRLVLLDVLSDAADEVTAALDGPTVEVRMRGRSPELVVTPLHLAADPPAPAPSAGADEEGTARLTLRLPETLKVRAEQAAASEGISVNTWLVRAVSRALTEPAVTPPSWPSGPRRLTGFGRA